MANKDFREYLPYHKNVVDTLLTITADTPTFTTINQLVITDDLPAGEYVLTLSYVWWMIDVNDSALFRVTWPITTAEIYRYEPQDQSDLIARTHARPVTFGGGPLTITFEGSKTLAAQDLNINWSTIEFERKT
jgi:hypothetical protein